MNVIIAESVRVAAGGKRIRGRIIGDGGSNVKVGRRRRRRRSSSRTISYCYRKFSTSLLMATEVP